MENSKLDYFVFPRLAYSDNHFRSLSLFLPRASIFEITRPAAIPPWCRDRITGVPVLRDSKFLELLKSCIQGYKSFAELHGGEGGTLGYLGQVLSEAGESRFRIQEELRGKCPAGLDAAQSDFLRSAVFLDISEELDRKELELEKDLARADALEKEFGEILGISGEEAPEDLPAAMSAPLVSAASDLGYMLTQRVRNWFRIFSAQSLDRLSVFVATDSESIGEALDLIRAEFQKRGKDFATSEFILGSFPKPSLLGEKQFRSLIESPGSPALLESYRGSIDLLVGEAGVKSIEEMEAGSKSAESALERFCRSCEAADRVSLRLYMCSGLSVNGMLDIFRGAAERPASLQPLDAGNQPAMFLCLE